MIRHLLANDREDLDLFARYIDKTLPKRLEQVLAAPFARMRYTEAVALLEKSGKKFEFPVGWGTDLQAEHERYLSEEICARPVFITDYPKDIKPFYMRLNDDRKTVAAFDLLLPGIGTEMIVLSFAVVAYSWYLDLRKFGTAPHSGFGLGFERFIQFSTGMTNIREVIPFPRTPGSALY